MSQNIGNNYFNTPFFVKIDNSSLEKKPFTVAQSFHYYSNRYKKLITIPVGFKTDFASVPRLLSWLILPFGKYSKAAIIHDYLIENRVDQDLNFHQINMIFFDAMSDLNVKTWEKCLIMVGVETYWTAKKLLRRV